MGSLRAVALLHALLIGLLAAAVAPVCAQPSAQTTERDAARARTHFQAGQALYALSRYEDALREFRAGYALVPKARFLLNIGHSHRRLGQLADARAAFQQFLERVPESDPDRAEARSYLAEVETALQNAPATPPVAEVAATPQALTTPAPPRRRALKHLAWALPLGAAVIVGVSLGAYFGTRPDPCAGATLSCVEAGR